MKILYIILTCEKNMEKNVKWIKNTWVNKVDNEDDFYFLSSIDKKDEKVIGFNNPDDYISLPLKFISFFRNIDINEYDWIYFCDDDTYVFPNRLKKHLENYNKDKKICFGRKGIADNNPNLFNIEFPVIFPSGGAGFAITKYLFNEIKKYMITNLTVPYSYNSDVSFGIWIREIEYDNFIDMCEILKAQNPDHEENKNIDYEKVVSLHYCEEKHFYQLFKIN